MIQTSIIKSFSWVVVANLITKPLWMFLFIYAARILGTEGFGIYTYAMSIASILGIFIDLGFDYISIREISREKENLQRYFFQILIVRLSILVILILLYIVIEYSVLNTSYEQRAAIISLLVFQAFTIVITYFKSIVSALQNFVLFSKILIIEKLLIIIVGFLSLYLFRNVLYFVFSITLINIIWASATFIFLRKNLQIKYNSPRIKNLKSLVLEGLPLLYINIFVILYFRVDVLILDYFEIDKSVIGIYGSLHRLLEMYLLFPTMLMSIAYPIITKNYYKNFQLVNSLVTLLLKVLIIIPVLLAVVVSLNSYDINLLLFGEEYARGSNGLVFIIWTAIPLGINFLLGNLLVSVKKERYSALSLGLVSIISIAGNIVLIPSISFVGSSIITSVVEYLILILYSYFCLKYFGNIQITSLFMKAIPVTFTSMLLIHLLNSYLDLPLIGSIVMGLSVTMSLLFIFKLINISDIENFIRLAKSDVKY